MVRRPPLLGSTAEEGAVYHDEILNDLRRSPHRRLVSAPSIEEKEDVRIGDGRYKIPRGGLFELVSFPNYLCELWVSSFRFFGLVKLKIGTGSNGSVSL